MADKFWAEIVARSEGSNRDNNFSYLLIGLQIPMRFDDFLDWEAAGNQWAKVSSCKAVDYEAFGALQPLWIAGDGKQSIAAQDYESLWRLAAIPGHSTIFRSNPGPKPNARIASKSNCSAWCVQAKSPCQMRRR